MYALLAQAVLTIAHRLLTIGDSDRIRESCVSNCKFATVRPNDPCIALSIFVPVVLDEGRIVEFAAPHELLQDRNGAFYHMVQRCGDVAALHDMASAKAAGLSAWGLRPGSSHVKLP